MIQLSTPIFYLLGVRSLFLVLLLLLCNWPGLMELPGPTDVVSPSGRTSSNLSDSIGAKYPSTLSVSSSKARNSQQQYMYPVLIFLTGGRLLS